MNELRTKYKGNKHQRAWLPVTLLGDIRRLEIELVVDTGSPAALILHPDLFNEFIATTTPTIKSNFGYLRGGMIDLYIPQVGLAKRVEAYSSSEVAEMVAESHPDFQGVLGLPILRLGEYGGNKDEFWFQHPHTTGINP